jgi:pimeloyl-ACP methyl ester carboxylesterase
MRPLRVARFLGGYLHDRPEVDEEEVPVGSGRDAVAATLYLPRTGRAVPAWIVLHGVTVTGRNHASLRRFSRALAASGAAVLVPDVPSWTSLHVDPDAAARAIRDGAAFLATRPESEDGPVGVVGFSVGATQALIAAAEPDLAASVRTVVGFGGYCDLHSALGTMCTGEFEWRGATHRFDPDPYGRWIVAGRHLASSPHHAGMSALAGSLLSLAQEAGRRGTAAYDSGLDSLKAGLRAELTREEQAVWDVLAHPVGARPDPAAARRLARELADAALRDNPKLDPAPALARLRTRVVLAHGRYDRLIPFTETLKLRESLRHTPSPAATVTRFFAHSTGAPGAGPLHAGLEAIRFLRLLGRAFAR